jgi:hypothetical protein
VSGVGAQPPDLSGKWSGRWVSDKNGHSGPLHARFRQVDGDTYRVAFRGRFWGVFPFFYRTTMNVEGTGEDVAHLTASRRLGPFGTFSTNAVATGTDFNADFSSRNDSGRFILSRRR